MREGSSLGRSLTMGWDGMEWDMIDDMLHR